AIQVTLLELEFWNPVAQQAADPVGALEDHHVVPGARQLLRDGEPGWTRAHDGHALAGLDRRRARRDPALRPRAVHDLQLHLLDGDRVLVDAQHAGGFTRCGT